MRKDLAGQKFNRLLAQYRTDQAGERARWLCICDCGQRKVVDQTHLVRGNTKSCGCLNSETTTRRNVERSIHGKWKTCEFRAWMSMIQRCEDPNTRAWPRYGGRGITVCSEWRHSFPAFLAYMGPRPSPSHSVDRKDNNKSYEPGNVRWATRVEQINNRECTVFAVIDGRRVTASDLARELGVSQKVATRRIKAIRQQQETAP